MKITFDKQSFLFDGERKFQISGEFPYFRIPKTQWEERLQLFLQCGGNCVATYVPWILHEQEENKILFDDCDCRDLTAFLQLTAKLGLQVMLRPGPYQYSEMMHDGLPKWLTKNYPEVLARDIDQKPFKYSAVSYTHPLFLSKVKKYFCAFAKVVKPFLSTNGGHVYMIQLDNELTGSHIWHGSIDYNRQGMGIGQKGGMYPLWLQNKYNTVQSLNDAYNTNYQFFEQVTPTRPTQKDDYSLRIHQDYFDFYCYTVAKFLEILRGYLLEFGIDVDFSHNVACTSMIPNFAETNKVMGTNFLLGRDSYYALNLLWARSNPSVAYLLNSLMACDFLKNMGQPYTIPELQCGTFCQFPPILKEDLYLSAMVNFASGVKGINHYVFSGGVNSEDIGNASEIYDYNAPVSFDGKVRPTYQALCDFHKFVAANEWLVSANRVVGAQIGYEWQVFRNEQYSHLSPVAQFRDCQRKTENCLQMTLMSSSYSPEFVELSGNLDISKPLFLVSANAMSQTAQQKVVDFLHQGGKVVLLGQIPQADLSFYPCDLLQKAVGQTEYLPNDSICPYIQAFDQRIYGVDCGSVINPPKDAKVFATHDGNAVAFYKKVGKGIFFNMDCCWVLTNYQQISLLENLLQLCSGEKQVESTNKNVYVTMFEKDDKVGVFVLNLYSGAQQTEICVYKQNKPLLKQKVTLSAHSVEFIQL